MAQINNFSSEYQAVFGDRFSVTLYWEPVAGANFYYVYRDSLRIKVMPPVTPATVQPPIQPNAVNASGQSYWTTQNGTQMIMYWDFMSWSNATSLDIFYWISSVTVDPTTGVEVESEKTGPMYNLHPFALHVIEEAQGLIADDLRKIDGEKGSVFGQVSLENYKVAIHLAISDINATPTPTNFYFGNFPRTWLALLTKGIVYYVLPKIFLLETAKTMQFNDQSQQWNPPDMKEAIKQMMEWFKEDYKESKTVIKNNVRPGPAAVGSLRALYISPQFLKFRHLDSGRPYF